LVDQKHPAPASIPGILPRPEKVKRDLYCAGRYAFSTPAKGYGYYSSVVVGIDRTPEAKVFLVPVKERSSETLTGILEAYGPPSYRGIFISNSF
jgi:hypothetical protein